MPKQTVMIVSERNAKPTLMPAETEESIGGQRLRKVFQSWRSLRGDKSAPTVEEFDPCLFKKVSGTMAMIEVVRDNGEFGFHFLALGSGLIDRFPSIFYGSRVEELEDSKVRDELMQRYRHVATTGKPYVARYNRHLHNSSLSYEALTMPLIDATSGDVTRLVSVVIYYPEHEFQRRFGRGQ